MVRVTRAEAGTAASSAAQRTVPGSSTRSAPSRCRASKKNGLRTLEANRPARLAVSWNGRARPAASMRRASPSRTAVRAGSARATATISGTRPVMSSRLRLKTPTSSPSRCTWIRMPSSLASTAAGEPVAASASSTLAAGCASIGASGRPTVSRNAAERRLAAGERGDRDLPEVAGEQQRPSHRGRRHVRRSRDRVGQQPRLRSLPELAGDDPAEHPLLIRGQRGEQALHQRLAAGLRARRRRRCRARRAGDRPRRP